MSTQISELAQKWTAELLEHARGVNNTDLVELCLKVGGVKGSGNSAPLEPRMILEGTAPKNHAIRFSFEESYRGANKTSWGFRPKRRSIFGGTAESQDYEEVNNTTYMTAYFN
jgi:hypothetical protein